jgi:UDP-N-acetyl-D-galactosamine dehydrogenase
MKITIVGLGYVGLPLAVAMAKKHSVTGFDVNLGRIASLNEYNDITLEVSANALQEVVKTEKPMAGGLYCTADPEDIRDSDYYIVTVPTPVDKDNKPNLTAL